MGKVDYQAKCLNQLRQSVALLGGDGQSPLLTETADLIIRSMTGPWRSFHTPEHIFDVGQGGGPVEILAALFHDVVYVQIDLGINVNLCRIVAPYIKEVDQTLVIDPLVDPQDELFQILLTLFGFAPGHKLSPFAGQNEFLSAVVAIKCLQPLLPKAVLVQIAACIEATIPFRGPSADGQWCSDVLLQRLLQVNESAHLGMDLATCHDTVVMGVRVSNRDIDNFSSEHAGDFLNNTWDLIPETNHELVSVNSYTVQGYRMSLQKMEGFLGFLKPEVVFRHFGDEPSLAEHQRRLALTQRNLEVARMYLRIKLVTIALLEALSLRIGQNVAMATLMGEIASKNEESSPSMEQFLPEMKPLPQMKGEIEPIVMELLDVGRTAESAHDTRHSPVSSYLVRQIGFEATLALLAPVRTFIADPSTAPQLLAACDPQVREGLVNAIAQVIHVRGRALISA